MALLDASGAADGTSTVTSDAAVRVARAAAFGGSASVVAAAGVGYLSNATFPGTSSLAWKYTLDASATFAGVAASAGNGSVSVAAKALAEGSSRFLYIPPHWFRGTAFITVVPVVDRHLRPLRAITLGPKTFRWLQPLQRGDLPVFVCDGHTPMTPFRVTYSLLQVRADGSRRYVGPRDRVPAAGEVGEFYATGEAGQGGQAGPWLIEWQLQRTAGSRPEFVEMRFRVLDAVAVGVPRDQLPRKTKFGWS